jgi:hypothetical protein
MNWSLFGPRIVSLSFWLDLEWLLPFMQDGAVQPKVLLASQ